MTDKHYDIVIVGAGPAGLSFAASFIDQEMKILIVEKQHRESIEKPQIDGRDIALTHYSKKILTELEVWERFDTRDISLIKQARVLDGDSDYSLSFSSGLMSEHWRGSDSSDGVLGYIIPNYKIRQTLYERVAAMSDVDIITGVSVKSSQSDQQSASVSLDNGLIVSCDLLVAADSRFSSLRRQMGIAADMEDFGRTVIVCRAHHEKKNPQIAYECFKYGSTLAVLPVNDNTASIVVTLSTDHVRSVMWQSEADFSKMVTEQFKHRLGNMTLIGDRYEYPLVAVLARTFIAPRFALVGDSAVGMHPVTAHGFNLGLRGQHTLAKLVLGANKQGKSIASDQLLQRYNRTHQSQCKPMYFGTNLLVRLFTNDNSLPKFLRKAVLHVSNNIPPLKKTITNLLTEING